MVYRQLATLATGLVLSAAVQAKNAPWYEVEVYIFSHPTQSTEKWSDTVQPVNTTSAVDFISPQLIIGSNDDIEPDAQISAEPTSADTQTTNESLNLNMDLTSEIGLDDVPLQPAVVRRLSHVPVNISASTPQQAYLNVDNVLLAESQSQFANYIASISREAGNESLLHMTWQQPMLPRHSAKAVRVIAGKDFSQEFTPEGYKIELALEVPQSYLDSDSNQITVANEYEQLEQRPPAMVEPIWQLDGKINIYLNHYLYVETALNYREVAIDDIKTSTIIETAIPTQNLDKQPLPADGLPKETSEFLAAIPMTQSRRVISGEVHYLDHPRLGILVQIRKMPQPETIAELDETGHVVPSVGLPLPSVIEAAE